MPLYLGLDSGTQSLTAVVIQIDRDQRGVVFETSLNFDEALPHYGTRNGVLPNDDPALALVPPLIWAEALDVMMTRLAGAGKGLVRGGLRPSMPRRLAFCRSSRRQLSRGRASADSRPTGRFATAFLPHR